MMGPGLGPVHGHEAVRASLARAAASGQLPNALLFHGPRGAGKQRLGLWLAQYLVCKAREAEGPCGRCAPCHLALRLGHPDIHWFFPLARPKVSGGPDRLGEALEEARGAELALRREQPFRPTASGEPVGIYLAHVQVLRRLAYTRPAAGDRKVFIVGDAELLVPQEASPEAANALLKVLEEPPEDTHVILTASDPDALLPTLRSRVLPIRVRALAESEVESFLIEVLGADPGPARLAARLGQGAIGRALAFLPDAGGPGSLEELRLGARALLEAALAGQTASFGAAHAQSPAGARGATFAGTLELLTVWLRDLAATAAGADDLVINIDAADWLRQIARRMPHLAAAVPGAIGAVDAAAQLSQFNVNPQLTVGRLLRSLREELTPAG